MRAVHLAAIIVLAAACSGSGASHSRPAAAGEPSSVAPSGPAATTDTEQVPTDGEAASRSPEGSDAPALCPTVCTRMIDCLVEASGKQLDPQKRAASETDCGAKCEGADEETHRRVRACLDETTCNAFADCVEAIELPQS